jgi:hypothetical protein
MFKWIGAYKNDEFVRKQIHFTCIYLGIMLLLLLVLWPGIWRWDEFYILERAVNLKANYWQHFLTSILYIFSLMVFPSPGTIIVVQISCISIIVGYILSTCYFYLKQSKIIYFLLIPFLLPPVIDNNFYPMRTTLYAYLELLFLFWIIHKKRINKGIQINDILFSSIITAILINWRSESIYYIILMPIILFVAFKSEANRKHKMAYLVLATIFTASMMLVQSEGLNRVYGEKYLLTSMISPLSMMVQEEIEEETLETIDKVMSVDILKEYASPYGINPYYVNGFIRENATKEEYSQLKQTYMKLVLTHLDSFMKYRLETLMATSGLYEDIRINIYDSSAIYDVDENGNFTASIYTYFNQFPFTTPIFKELRKNTIRWLESRDLQNIEEATVTYGIYYNVIAIFFILMSLLIYMIIKKAKIIALFLAGLLIKYGLIFATAPGKTFMYYFPIYLGTLVIFTLVIMFEINNRKGKGNVNLYV